MGWDGMGWDGMGWDGKWEHAEEMGWTGEEDGRTPPASVHTFCNKSTNVFNTSMDRPPPKLTSSQPCEYFFAFSLISFTCSGPDATSSCTGPNPLLLPPKAVG